MSEVEPFAAEAVNEITPANVRSLGYWLASMIVVVTVFICGVYWDDVRDQEKHEFLHGEVKKLTEIVGELSDAQIRADVERDNIRDLALQERNDTHRRFIELIRRIDEAIARI